MCTSAIRGEIRKRMARIRTVLADETPTNFPRQEVREVLEFSKIDTSPACRSDGVKAEPEYR
jgi:hypothetical protein